MIYYDFTCLFMILVCDKSSVYYGISEITICILCGSSFTVMGKIKGTCAGILLI